MSDSIKHECGIAFIRLLKPLSYYKEKYGEALWGLNRIQLLMAKQINRGQDGAGLGIIKLNPEFGHRYIARKRSNTKNPVIDLFEEIQKNFNHLKPEQVSDIDSVKKNFPYLGELYLGHLRYGTHGGNSVENLHPFLRQNNWMSRNLVLAGNYNLTNVDELYKTLIDLGQQPKEISDNVTMLEKIGHFLDEENELLFRKYKDQGLTNIEITAKIKDNLNLCNILKKSFKELDGGYNLVGMIGHGDAFVMRDPNGIRPSFYFGNEEVLVAASERSAICTVFDLKTEEVKELEPGHAIVVKHTGNWSIESIIPQKEKKSCSFERVYFSKGNDKDIYQERRNLGRLLAPIVLKKLDYDMENTVFSYIPNTASTCFYGLIDGVNDWLDDFKINKILENKENLTEESLKSIFKNHARREKILLKDVKLRTFITNDNDRAGIVGSAYDITYGSIKKTDTLVIVDDSIVRGTTLKKSILSILKRLEPKKIIIVSSCPQIRYPDCYGIDMSKMNDFVAFRAVLELLKDQGKAGELNNIYKACVEENKKPVEQIENKVKVLYDMFHEDEISAKIASITKPKEFKPELEIIFQTIENLHKSCPGHTGDWYFSGDYPTPGGNKVVNKSFIYFMEGVTQRAY